MKRIAFMSTNLQFGGVERIIAELSCFFSEKGHDVHIFLMDTANIAYRYGGKIHKISFFYKKNSPLMTVFTLQHWILTYWYKLKYKIDITISALEFMNLLNLLTPAGDKKIVTMHNYFLQSEITPTQKDILIEKWFSRIVKKAAFVVAVSEELKQKAKKLYDLGKGRIIRISNASDFENIQRLVKEPLDNQDILDFCGENTFVSLSRLAAQKSLHTLIVAFKSLLDKKPSAKLIIIGDGPLREGLEALAGELGISKNILFTGFLSNPFNIMAKCRAFVLSSHFEGFGNVIVEALCCGLTVISADCKCGPREILSKNNFLEIPNDPGYLLCDYGILTLAGDGVFNSLKTPSSLAIFHAMERVLNDKTLDYAGEKAINRALDFTPAKIYSKWNTLIEKM